MERTAEQANSSSGSYSILGTTTATLTAETARLQEQKAALEEQDASLQEQEEALAGAFESYMGKYAEGVELVSKGSATFSKAHNEIAESSNAMTESMNEDTESRMALNAQELEKLAEYESHTTSMFGKIGQSAAQSAAELTQNLESNQETVRSWSENLAILAERGVDQGLLEELRKAGPKMAPTVEALVAAADTELVNLSESYRKGAEVAMTALVTELGDPKYTKDLTGHGETAGQSFIEGEEQALLDGISTIREAAEQVSEGLVKATAEALDAHSPSRKAIELGEWFDEGLIEGLRNREADVLRASEELALQAVSSVAMVIPEFREAGWQMGEGVAQGIYDSIPAAVSAARSLAAEVAAAMRTEMDIQSPSEVTRKIFRQVGEGAVLGLEDERELLRQKAHLFTSTAIQEMTRPARTGQAGDVNDQSTQQQGKLFEDVNVDVTINGSNLREPGEVERIARRLGDSVAREMHLRGVMLGR